MIDKKNRVSRTFYGNESEDNENNPEMFTFIKNEMKIRILTKFVKICQYSINNTQTLIMILSIPKIICQYSEKGLVLCFESVRSPL